jgi:ABC-type methionine transport system ATPase subunit
MVWLQDEATSALDSRNEEEVLHKLLEVSNGLALQEMSISS